MIARFVAPIATARALGIGNIARVMSYRLRLKAGVHRVQRLATNAVPSGPFFVAPVSSRTLTVPKAWQRTANYFGWYHPGLGDGPPDWHANPFDGRRAPNADAAWWTIPDFDSQTGDVKAIWEASRFDWVLNFAQQVAAGQEGSLQRLNAWLDDWCVKNPLYKGHNWKCAQEASIRVMHLAAAALILDNTPEPSAALVELVAAHLRRIEPTLSYATGQDNNHGTSEAAALFIGGSWFERLGRSEGAEWHRQGRALLENRVRRLVAPDGSFSQHSVNYHRLMLDTLSIVEVWRRHLALPAFSATYASRASAASAWLRTMVDAQSGDAPNYGANDGANLLPLTDVDYRDYRPSVQLATALFEDRAAYAFGPWQTQLEWLGVKPVAERAAVTESVAFDDGGLAVLTLGRARAVLRYPRFRFRPGHADALHVDFTATENLLRDGGSFGYATEPALQDYFAGARGHNAVQFDGHEQMPRLGRFLWGAWLKTDTLEPVHNTDAGIAAGASYRDAWGAVHARRVELASGSLTVTDRLSGFASKAVLRWRLRPGAWVLDGTAVSDGRDRLKVTADVPIVRCEIVDGWESRYYMKKTPIPVLEVEVSRPGTIVSEYRFPA